MKLDLVCATRKNLTLLAAAALIVAATVAAPAAVSFFGLNFPDRVAAAKLGPINEYEKTKPGLGYGVEYLQPNWKINIFIYDLGKTAIPDDLASEVLTSQLKQAQGDILELQKQGIYAKVDLKRNRTLKDGGGRPRFLCSDFAYVHAKAGNVDSFLCLTGWKNKFVKFRLTAAQHGGSQAEADRFMQAWAKLLWPGR